MEYSRIVMGKRICSLRAAKGMTQEQLAEVLCVSPAAVSKWERNLAIPNVEMLWMLADYFGCTIDELVGRRQEQLERVGIYDEEKLRLVAIAGDLLQCSEISRQKGLLALEKGIAGFQGGSEFLSFAIRYILQAFMKQMDVGRIVTLLSNYAETLPKEQNEGPMVVAALEAIVSGEAPELISETIASYIGMDYWKKIIGDKSLQDRRSEILERFRDKEQYSTETDLLESFAELGDFEIQTILRNLDNDVFTAAMCGASGTAAIRFLANLSDRVLAFISEDIANWKGTEEEILEAQRRVVEIRNRCCQ
ncbi:MAG: helix-turn-helix domain-containing protein [Acetatifactor sp.]|nr:helix-turn-helix domain-containing protein [Acetatifactor sp.]